VTNKHLNLLEKGTKLGFLRRPPSKESRSGAGTRIIGLSGREQPANVQSLSRQTNLETGEGVYHTLADPEHKKEDRAPGRSQETIIG